MIRRPTGGEDHGRTREKETRSSFDPYSYTARVPSEIIYRITVILCVLSAVPDEGFGDDLDAPTQRSGS